MTIKTALPAERQATPRKALRQANAIGAISGYAKTEQRKALDNAMLAGSATPDAVQALLMLEARLLGARDVLAKMDKSDVGYATMQKHFDSGLAALCAQADDMGGAVRQTLKISPDVEIMGAPPQRRENPPQPSGQVAFKPAADGAPSTQTAGTEWVKRAIEASNRMKIDPKFAAEIAKKIF